MTKPNKTGRSNRAKKLQSKRFGAPVLVATAALLGTSLGVSAAAPDQPTAEKNTAISNTAQRKPFDQTILADKVIVKPPFIAVKPSTALSRPTGKGKSIELDQKNIQSNQVKPGKSGGD